MKHKKNTKKKALDKKLKKILKSSEYKKINNRNIVKTTDRSTKRILNIMFNFVMKKIYKTTSIISIMCK